jgi:hypothetical protein
MPIIYQKWITRVDLRANPSVLYVFGDNVARVGLGGQAKEMRGEPNAVGIATKWSPSEFFDEARTNEQCRIIEKDMVSLNTARSFGRLIVLPLDGLGTGLADLSTRAPTTFAYLQEQLKRLHLSDADIEDEMMTAVLSDYNN